MMMGRWSRKQEIAIILSKYKRKGAHATATKFDSRTARALIESGSVQVTDRHSLSGGQGQGQNWLRKEKRLAIYQRDNHTCAWCKTHVTEGVKLTLDHLTPHSLGGSNAATNLVTTCLSCNSKRGNRSVIDFAKSISGYLGESATDIIKRVRSTVRKSIDVRTAKVLLSRLKVLAQHPKLNLEDIAQHTDELRALSGGASFAMKLPGGGLRTAINARKAEGHRASDERTVYRSQRADIDISEGMKPQLHESSLEAEGHRSLNRQVHTGSRRIATMHGNMMHKTYQVYADEDSRQEVPIINLYKIRVPKKQVVTRTAKYYRGDLHKTSMHQEPDVPIYGPEYLSVTTIPRKKIRKVGVI